MKKGFTLIEILWTTVILGVLMAVVASLYVVALKDYQINFTKSGFQKDTNFVIDDINKNIKQSAGVLQTCKTDNLGASLLILAIPVTDSSGNFVYTNNGQTLTTSVVLYKLSGSDLHKITYSTDSTGACNTQNSDKTVAKYVTSLGFTYQPTQTTAETVSANLVMQKVVEKVTVRTTGTTTGYMRNIQ